MSIIYLKVTIKKLLHSELQFPSFKKLVSKSVFATEKSEVLEQKSVWLFHYFYFERNDNALKLKILCFLLIKNVNSNKNETESKMENPTHSFREMNLMLQLV